MEFTPEQEYDSEQRMIDRYLQARYSFWNAILTFNGIVLSVFIALAAINPKSVDELEIKSVIILCSISISLVVVNYFITTKLLRKTGILQPQVYYAQKDPNEDWSKDFKEYERNVKKISNLSFYIPIIVEWTVVILFLVEMFIFIYFTFI